MDPDRKRTFTEPTLTEEASLADVTLQTADAAILGWPDIGAYT